MENFFECHPSSLKKKKKSLICFELISNLPTYLHPSPSISNPLSSPNPESKNLNELERSVGPPLHRPTSPYKVNRKKAEGSKERSAFTRFLHHRLFETFRYVHVGMYFIHSFVSLGGERKRERMKERKREEGKRADPLGGLDQVMGRVWFYLSSCSVHRCFELRRDLRRVRGCYNKRIFNHLHLFSFPF